MWDETECAELEGDDGVDFVSLEVEFDGVVDLDLRVDVSESSAVVGHWRLAKNFCLEFTD